MLRRVAAVIIDVSEERIASIIRITRTIELGRTLAVIGNRSTLRGNTMFLRNICFYKPHGFNSFVHSNGEESRIFQSKFHSVNFAQAINLTTHFKKTCL
jgi:hypothetical protein